MKHGRSLHAVAAAVLAAATCVSAPAAARPLVPSDLFRLVSLSSPAISPDGTRVALVVGRVDLKTDKTLRDLDLVDVATHARRTLTYKRTGLSDPAWSPDGTKLAFIADEGTGDDAKSQVFVMPMDGGDARPVTSAPDGVNQFAWRPDGAAIAYAAEDAKPKKTGVDKYRDAFVVGNVPITARGMPRPVHLWLVPAAGGTAKQLTRGDSSVFTGEAQTSLSWSKDGTTIAFALAPNAVLNDATRGRIALVDVGSGAVRTPTGHDGRELEPHFSPDGTHLAYAYADDDNQITLTEGYVTTPAGGAGTPVTRPLDRAIHQLAYGADGALYVQMHDGTRVRLARVAADGAPQRLDLGDLNPASPLEHAIARDGRLAFVASTATAPAELYVASAGAAPVKLTEYNAPIAALALGTAETISYRTTLGIDADAVLLTPAGYVAGRRYPLVVAIHGGPTSASTTAFDRLAQLMLARGWLVLEPNYRGSDNLGLAYQRAVRYDPSEGPGKDVMAALDAVRHRGIVDDRRIAVSGWSYGGIMTAWMITHYHVWRAAVSGASVNDWTTDYGTADDLDADKALFHGSPFVAKNRAEYQRASAVNYAADVTTPTLILSDVGDNRDPYATSMMFYRALRDNGKDATFVAWPVDGHFPRDPVRTVDVYTHWIDYIARHFG